MSLIIYSVIKKTPALITRIGPDENGKELFKRVLDAGVCTDHFQIDHIYETGKVYATPNEVNEVVYDIVKPAAWDHISWDASFAELVMRSDYFVFGSLAARNKTSRSTLFTLLEIAKNKVLDINLRAPYYGRKITEELISKADFLKLNISELELITGWFSKYKTIPDRVEALRDRFNTSKIVVTKGCNGAEFYINNETISHPGFKVRVADTVGSGDAFLAGLLSKLAEGENYADAMEYGSALGAFIATKRGACPDYRIEEIESLITGTLINV